MTLKQKNRLRSNAQQYDRLVFVRDQKPEKDGVIEITLTSHAKKRKR